MNDIQLVLTSAVVSAVVSGTFAMWSQHLERKNRQLENEAARKARQDELLLAKAVELALDEKKTLLEISRTSKRGTLLTPDILSIAELYRYLRFLLENKTLPNDLKATLRDQLNQVKMRSPKDSEHIDHRLGLEDLRLEESARLSIQNDESN